MVTNFIILYFNLKPSIYMNLLPSLNDGCHPTASFDILICFCDFIFFSRYTHLGELTMSNTLAGVIILVETIEF